MADLLTNLAAVAGAAGGGPTGSYIACAHTTTPNLLFLDHTTPDSVSLAATYTFRQQW
jgi:hypothetical protein